MRYATAGRWLPACLRRSVWDFEARLEAAAAAFGESLEAGARVLDAGAGECRYKPCFARQRYVGVDLGVGDAAWNYSKLDALADLSALPFADASFDGALSLVVLEHLKEPARALKETARVLRPGARLLVAAPLDWEVHQAPHDYFRYTCHGLRHLLEQAGFEVERMEAAGGLPRLLGRRMLGAVALAPGLWKLPVGLLLGPAGADAAAV